MNKLGIWAIAIATAFVIGVLSANPVVEAVGGWKVAIADHETRITDLENQELPINTRYLVYEDSECTPVVGHPIHPDEGWCPSAVRSSFMLLDADVDENSIIIGQTTTIVEGKEISGLIGQPFGCNTLTVRSATGFPDAIILSCSSNIDDSEGRTLRLLITDPVTP